MLKPLPSFRPVVSLIPNSGLQFLDFGFDIDRTSKLARSYWEERRPLPPGEDLGDDAADFPTLTLPEGGGGGDGERMMAVLLRCLRPHPEDGVLYDPVSGQVPPDDEVYTLNKIRGLEVFLNKWVPIPFLRVKSENAPGVFDVDRGPSNWARVRVTELDERDHDGNTHRVVMAFDTELRELEEGRPYLVPTPRDSEEESRFAFVHEDAQNGWFLNEPWVDEWLDELFREFKAAQRPGRPLRDEDFPNPCEHWARYLTFLEALKEACGFPVIRMIDTVSRELNFEPIDVDLVLDVGNSRTCGILIEHNPDDRLDLNDAYVLELRDLTQPEQSHILPFESRVEFAHASFGKDSLSRRSGRGKGFFWASVVRVGPEAVRLAGGVRGTEGTTGLSSPKRYLWDRRAINQVWRYNSVETDSVGHESPVSGPFMAYVTEDGDVLRQKRGRGTSAVRAKFSRSSLFSFMLCEIILQAILMMNSPETRSRRKYADVPRQLRRIIMTLPPATPLAEQKVMRERAEAAVKLTWDVLGWTQGNHRMPVEPGVLLAWDEASCTHLVYLYTEITQKFQGGATDFFNILGKLRDGYDNAPTLRVASIDIGGGTTDLMVTTYQIEGNRAINPTQNFREGFKIAGDDVVQAVVERHVLPPLEKALAAAGVGDAKALLRRLFSDRGGMSEQERHLRRQFVLQVCVPIALSMLHAYESARPFSIEPTYEKRFADFFDDTAHLPDRVLDYLGQAVRDERVADFVLADVRFDISFEALGNTVRRVLGEILADLCEVVHSLDCDVLLVSGRPSRLPAVTDAILAHLPVPADRIVPMHQYRVGNWYPFRDTSGRIDDPKTTAAVGSMLCALAEGQIQNFLLRTSMLRMRSTARFVGEMEISGQIKNDRILFSDIDLETKANQKASGEAKLKFYAPTFIGFRQLPIERWPATPLYYLDFANPQSAARMRLPLLVTLERADAEDNEDGRDDHKEDFKVTEIEDADETNMRPTDVDIRLQTLKDEAGYWLDTGVLSVF
ncbi:MAG: virulence factor SrfB [Rhodospirillaceae bacterium]|nr:virulence factor SrfB [Rhodospirillaceae bacterium]